VSRDRVMRVLGVDIGGANLKYATSDGVALATNFPMWRQPDQLAATLVSDFHAFSAIDAIAVTMTGELADCFVDRAVGVHHIVEHTIKAATAAGLPAPMFYGVDGRFHAAVRARDLVDQIAAANWHALASFVAQDHPEATLVDIGSTTTDIIPIKHGTVATDAQSDHDRLLEGSLVYVGCRRTPVCGLVHRLNFRGQACRVMNELFATIDDARLLLGRVEQDAQDCDSADGKPRTVEFAANRLARMIGLDRRQVSVTEAIELAAQVVAAATLMISQAAVRLVHAQVVISGHGEDLLENLPVHQQPIRLSDRLGLDVSRCAQS
jgi:(4-(4-[2-(gamma-L-glutamylamino)ethyl]phenoxymethyl)furan-2-yl)methanamine synthase